MKRLQMLAFAIVVAIAALAGVPIRATAQEPPTISPVRQDIALAGSPFAVVPSPDGKHVFASESQEASEISIVERVGTGGTLVGTIQTQNPVFGLAITRDGRYLLDTIQKNSPANPLPAGVQIIDVRKALAGEAGAILGTIPVTAAGGPITVELSNDEHYAFVADEDDETVGVIDFQKAIASGVEASDLIGYVPVEGLPVGFAFSPDGRYLYVTNEEAAATHADYDGSACAIPKPGGGSRPGPEGTVTIVDLQKAESEPASSVVGNPYAGCTPVRVELSEDGSVAWVTNRASNQLTAYDREKLLTDPAHALISETPVGVAPVGMQLFDDGRLIAVANSNRFMPGDVGTVSIVDTRRALRGAGQIATLGTFQSGEFPRQFGLSPDGRTLYLTEFSSKTLAIFPVPDLVAAVHPAGEFAFSVSTGGSGSGTVACRIEGRPETPCAGEYEAGLAVEVIPHPAPGSEFGEWIGACSGGGPCQVTVDSAKALGAIFKVAPAKAGGGATPGGPIAPGPIPASRLKLRSAKARGAFASLAVDVSGPGTVKASGRGLVPTRLQAKRAGRVHLKLRLTGAARKALARRGSFKARVKVVFTPAGGSPRSAAETIAFRSRGHS